MKPDYPKFTAADLNTLVSEALSFTYFKPNEDGVTPISV
jgi:hypothetical protein